MILCGPEGKNHLCSAQKENVGIEAELKGPEKCVPKNVKDVFQILAFSIWRLFALVQM